MALRRREFVQTAVAGAALGAAGTVTAQEEPDYGGWFDDVSNYDGTVDKRGQDTVEIAVGAQGNNGAFAFAPPAVMVSPGTEVVWTWTGEGGGHNVVSDGDGPLDSGELVSEQGATYSYTFESEGMFKYVCEPHVGLGMKGAVVVRPGGGSSGGGTAQQGPPANPDYGGWFDDVSNYDGETLDRTGQDSVEIAVGAQGNNGAFAFDPPAVRVSPGTEVVFTWTGEGGGHNVVSDGDGPLDSGDPVAEAGTTYSYTFEETGIYKYVCEPHLSLGMKGAVVVGGPPGGGGGGGGGGTQRLPVSGPRWLLTGSVLFAFFTPLLYAAAMRHRESTRPPQDLVGEDGTVPVEEATAADPAVELGHEEFDPTGTAALVAFYFVLIALLWVFMYFVEFLGRVSVIG
ncbi:halocyanin domain-containing protein [Halomicroarcula sp. S1AR25-4]|uniref:halocyanin domain-containing protein n=1 Tax=Haloarcula sp. S1AR25-4 TaxID=2950538 RepID=UPI002874F71B|nr:halocyanin domain-containing protein [Halomicroarcula sp. S1AR25-4]MDS0277636.1 halocyanin domain-containing protein [Halomicroarcula sp. S1AR25-4]